MNTANNGEPASALWCVELVPKLKSVKESDKEKFLTFAKGMPGNPIEAMMWTAQAFSGFNDQRTPQFARDGQRLVVFKVKAHAMARARKATNEYWSAKVRAVKIA
jgi:hypothetical protein